MVKKFFRYFRIAILIICIAVFLVSAVMLVDIIIEYAKAERTYDDINDKFLDGLGDETGEPLEDEAPERLVKLSEYVKELKSEYPDVIGYINVPSLGISYPVVQTDNNDYYLDHMVNGEESSSGAIFLDCNINSDPQKTKNTVLYGHNMNNGSMFHPVVDLFYYENFVDATVEYVTEDAIFIYEPYSIYRAEAYYPFFMYEFTTDEGFLEFCDMILEKTFYRDHDAPEYDKDSSFMTFSTCTNSISSITDRFVYHSILVKEYTDIHKEK